MSIEIVTAHRRARGRPSRLRIAAAFALLALPLAASAGCSRTVNDYLAEARSNAPPAVREAVVAIGEILYRKETAGIAFDEADEVALLYIKDVASGNTIPINRAAAVAALGRLRKSEAGPIFIGAIRDPFWLCRLEAARAIEFQPDERYAEPLRDALASEARPEVRLEIVKALGQVKGPVALRTLLDIFLKRSDRVVKDPQVVAFFAIKEMTGLEFTFDQAMKWEEYYRTKYGEAPGSQPTPAAPVEEQVR